MLHTEQNSTFIHKGSVVKLFLSINCQPIKVLVETTLLFNSYSALEEVSYNYDYKLYYMSSKKIITLLNLRILFIVNVLG